MTQRTLHKTLGLPFAMAISAGTVIGSGIMRTPGVIAGEVPLPWLALALWAAAGVLTFLAANIAAELSTAMPSAGGIYVPVREAFGDGLGLLAGWAMWAGYVGGVAALSLAVVDFLATVFPGLAAHNVLAALTVLAVATGLNILGVQEGRLTQIVGSLLKVALLLAVIVAAAVARPDVAPSVAAPTPAPVAGGFGTVAIITAFQLILGAYDGWIAPAFFAEEDTNPGRNIPRALFRSVAVIMMVYLAVNAALFAVLDLDTMRSSDLPMALVIDGILGESGRVFVGLFAAFMAAITLNGLVITSPRILFGLARDGLFLRVARRVNAGGTPWVALAIASAIAVPLIMTGAFVFVFKIQTALGLLAFALYNASYFALRHQQPDLARPFRAVGHPVLPAIAMATSVAIFAAVICADPSGAIWTLGLVAICLPVGIHLGRQRRRAATAAPAIPT